MVINIGSLRQSHKARGMKSLPPPKQIRQWQNIAYLHLPAPGQALSGLKENREFLWGQKDLKKPALDLSCLCWQKIRLILKQIYCFGFSPRLTGMGPNHDFRTQPGRQWATWVILRNTLASWESPGTWARFPGAFSDLSGEQVLSQNLFQGERWEKDHPDINKISQPWLSLVDSWIKINGTFFLFLVGMW